MAAIIIRLGDFPFRVMEVYIVIQISLHCMWIEPVVTYYDISTAY